MSKSLKIEVDKNYDFFQRNLSKFLEEYDGKYLLLKSASVVKVFDDAGSAYRAGLAKYQDRLFSIQEVTKEPLELGMVSLEIA